MRISYQGGPPIEITINANVAKSTVSANAFDKLYNGEDETFSIPALLSNPDTQLKKAGLRKFHALIDQLIITKADDQEMKDFIDNLKYQAATDILNVSLQLSVRFFTNGNPRHPLIPSAKWPKLLKL